MKKICALAVLALWLVNLCPARGEVKRSAFLDHAFSALEKGNIFIERYNALTGADVEALFELGIQFIIVVILLEKIIFFHRLCTRNIYICPIAFYTSMKKYPAIIPNESSRAIYHFFNIIHPCTQINMQRMELRQKTAPPYQSKMKFFICGKILHKITKSSSGKHNAPS